MNMKRMRGRNHRPNGVGGGGGGGGFRNQQNGIPLNRNHVFDSSGPEMRIRGTAQQLHEKYTQLARDASSSGDRVTGESYYQYAEHYFRIISAINQASGQNGQPAPNQNQPQANGQNGFQPNGQAEYQNRRPQHNPSGGNYYQEPGEPAAEPRAYEPRPPSNNQNFHDRRDDRPRQEYRQEPRQEPRQEARPEFRSEPAAERRVDPRIDISLALEAELAAAAAAAPSPSAPPARNPAPAGAGDQPSLDIGAAPRQPAPQVAEPRAIPISAAPPADAEPVIRPRPRGRPRLIKPEAAKPETI